MTDDARVHALRVAVGELLAGYSEVAKLLPELAPEDVHDPLLAPLRRAADSAAAALAEAS